MDDGCAVDLQHVQKPLCLDLGQLAVLAEARVVDEQMDRQPFFLREGVDLLRRFCLRQVRNKNFNLDVLRLRGSISVRAE